MKFEKVSFDEFKKYTDGHMRCGKEEYEKIPLPARSTFGSAGYDISSPVNITIPAGCKRVIPTGLKISMDSKHCLFLFIRSSLAIKKQIELVTSVSVIDSDYYGNESNEGHIMLPVKNESSLPVFIAAGERVAQGVLVRYDVTVDDDPQGTRKGGIGSTDE